MSRRQIRLQQVADAAAEKGLKFALEIHQGSIADNSKATLRLLEMVGRPNVGINPDLGNILWSYNIPEESWADTIQNTAGKMIFWHIKNMRRVYLPEANRSVFIRTNVPGWRDRLSLRGRSGPRGRFRRLHQRRGQHGHRGRRLPPFGDQHRIPALDHRGP